MIGHMNEATVIHNNLGGMGPVLGDPPVITYLNVGTCDGRQIDLMLSNFTRYTPEKAALNGKDGKSEKFGFVNMECGTNSGLQLNFYTNSSPVMIEKVYFSFHDIDSGNQEIVKEWMGVYSDFDESWTVNDTELIEEAMSPTGTLWRSSMPGNGPDNPTDPMDLTDQQKKRTATVSMTNAAFVDLDFGVTHKPGCNGRNFMFSFKGALAPLPTPAPTPSPSRGDDTCSTCVIWGDPHVITFKAHERRLKAHPNREAFFRTREWKSDQVTVNEAGHYWLVHNDEVHIQGSYAKNEATNTTSLDGLAIGGAFLDNKLIIIRPLGGKTMFDGKEILSSQPSEFQDDLVDATYHKDGKMVKDGTRGPAMDFALPSGVSLTVNRWKDSLAVEIKMCSGAVGDSQGGQCGSLTNDGL
jgi:hypothetical protein